MSAVTTPLSGGDAARPHSLHGSPLARLSALVAVALVLYASLYPFTGWSDTGVDAFAYLSAPWPRYWVGLELTANLIAYVPLGAVLVWALYPMVRGHWAVLLVLLLGSGLSASIEALQTYLPTRIASNVDLGANAAGTLLGAVAGALTARRLIDGGAVMRWRVRWFARDARSALLLAGLWVVLQVPRQPLLFGTGDVSVLIGDWLAPVARFLRPFWVPTPEERMLAELLCTALAVLAASLLLTHRARSMAPRWLAPWLLVGAALACKVLLLPLANPSVSPFAWATVGALSGIVVGGLLASALAYAGSVWQRALGLTALLAQLLVVNFLPAEQYFDAAMTLGRTRLFHFEQLLLGLAVVWPVAALWVFVRRRAALPR